MRRSTSPKLDPPAGPPAWLGLGLLAALLVGTVIYLGIELDNRTRTNRTDKWTIRELQRENERLTKALGEREETIRFLKER